MTPPRRHELAAVALAAQFEKLVRKAARAGIAVVVDADACALRLIPRDVVDRGDDLRRLGDVVGVHGGCGEYCVNAHKKQQTIAHKRRREEEERTR